MNNKDFMCTKCGKKTEILHFFGPVLVPEKEKDCEYCDKCWEKHPLNKLDFPPAEKV